MKIKNLITILSLSVIFIFNAAFSLASAEGGGDNSHTESTTDSHWLKNHRRTQKKVKDSITVGLEGDVNTLGIGFFRVNTNIKWVFVQCCKYTVESDYWCNAALQDKRC
ncbi:MAG: hypothetical protein U9N86_14760 [Bacteroidota bacterium]|nr:hypothetical protein [Bacteroidota bacterium]